MVHPRKKSCLGSGPVLIVIGALKQQFPQGQAAAAVLVDQPGVVSVESEEGLSPQLAAQL